jgi:hypothetical protein
VIFGFLRGFGADRVAIWGDSERIEPDLKCGWDMYFYYVILGVLRGFGADRVAIWGDSERSEPGLKLFISFIFLLLGHQEIERILDELEKLCGWNVYFYYVILGVLRGFGADRVAIGGDSERIEAIGRFFFFLLDISANHW